MIKIHDSILLNELAEILNGKPVGENITITGVSGVDDVEEGQITWVEGKNNMNAALNSKASAIILAEKLYLQAKDLIKVPCITVDNPRASFANTLEYFYERSLPHRGVAPTARIGRNTNLGKGVSIGEYAVIGKDCDIGEGTTIFPMVYIGDNVKIGINCLVYPFGVINTNSEIGKEVIIHSGAVIGADGFGFVVDQKKHIKIPQVGIVRLGDNVEIGANVTVDRATTGVTIIGSGTKIDNLVQIGHNNHVGKNCILVSQCGVAGSCDIGDNVTLAAQAGLAPHVKIGSNTVVGGRGGVTHDIPPNSVVSGFPAVPHKEALKLNGYIHRLPKLSKTVKELEQRIQQLEQLLKTEVEVNKSSEEQS